tara:strand:- start:1078 stop:1986 length:909 start_codon:yes stop_codon:yes gene_type:complete
MIVEIRESIEQTTVQLDEFGFAIIQKEINLAPGMRHTMVQADLFQDTIITTAQDAGVSFEYFVTPYPVIYTEMNFQDFPFTQGNRGPAAAVDTVLFKAILTQGQQSQLHNMETFPNQTLGTIPTFSWYTPRLYITILVHGFEEDIVKNLSLSFYIAIDEKKVSQLQAGLGILREWSIAQGMNLVNQGRMIPKADNVGQIFPMWKHGGIAPEYMIRGNAIADFFTQYHSTQSEKTMNTTNIRTFVRAANTMVASGEAFGAVDPSKGPVPDWIKFGLSPGLITGPIRPQWPPLKYFDNGNGMTL